MPYTVCVEFNEYYNSQKNYCELGTSTKRFPNIRAKMMDNEVTAEKVICTATAMLGQ